MHEQAIRIIHCCVSIFVLLFVFSFSFDAYVGSIRIYSIANVLDLCLQLQRHLDNVAIQYLLANAVQVGFVLFLSYCVVRKTFALFQARLKRVDVALVT